MTRPTIKSLQAQLENIRELREGDRQAIMKARDDNEKLKQRTVTLGNEIEDLRKDKDWLKQMCRHIVAPDRSAR